MWVVAKVGRAWWWVVEFDEREKKKNESDGAGAWLEHVNAC